MGEVVAETPMLLMVAVPCLNEERTVQRVISGVPKEIPGVGQIDIVVIDDGSSDQTAARAKEAGATVVVHPRNRGLGATFREAVDLALARGADILINIDGDGQFDPADIPKLVLPIVERRAAMATASRFVVNDLAPEMPAIKRWGNRRVADIVAILAGERFQDVSCGFRAFSSEALLRLNLFGSFTYTQESFVDLVFKELAILEVPVAVRGTREFGSSRVASNIPRYALQSLQIMLRAFISHRPIVFFSAVATAFALPGLSLLLFLVGHYLRSGSFSPHIWAGFVGGSLSFLAASTVVLGLVGDMLMRIRLNQESALYFLKRAQWQGARASRSVGSGPTVD